MGLAEARKGLDEVIHSPVRLTIMSALASVDSVDYQTLRQEMDVSYALLSKHAAILEKAGYVAVIKQFNDRTPTTRYRLTRSGRTAHSAYLTALDEVVCGLSKSE